MCGNKNWVNTSSNLLIFGFNPSHNSLYCISALANTLESLKSIKNIGGTPYAIPTVFNVQRLVWIYCMSSADNPTLLNLYPSPITTILPAFSLPPYSVRKCFTYRFHVASSTSLSVETMPDGRIP